MLNQNIARQPPRAIIAPPMGGPIPAASPADAPTMPKAAARRCWGTHSRISAAPFGVAMALDRACPTRIARSVGRLGAKAAPMEARANPTSAPRKSLRRPKRSPSLPAMGWVTAIVIR